MKNLRWLEPAVSTVAVRGLVDLLFDLLNGKINAQWVSCSLL